MFFGLIDLFLNGDESSSETSSHIKNNRSSSRSVYDHHDVDDDGYCYNCDDYHDDF
ncbi:MAG: hypothetical protein IKU72_04390 [Oscillospiraceae bacterium]|nr:hypothetical protein [Oscillospiraceae bacterium]